MKVSITVVPAAANCKTQVAFRICAPFTTCITIIDGITIGDAEDLDLVMPLPVCKLIEYRLNYFDAAGSSWFYSKDEATDCNNYIVYTDASKSFKYKAKLLGDTEDDIIRNATIAVTLKYLINSGNHSICH